MRKNYKKDLIMRINTVKWQGERPPPPYSPQKAQTTVRLFAPLFFLDRLLQGSLSNDRGICRNLLNKGGKFNKKSAFLSEFGQKRKIICISVGIWYLSRAPPFLTFAHNKC